MTPGDQSAISEARNAEDIGDAGAAPAGDSGSFGGGAAPGGAPAAPSGGGDAAAKPAGPSASPVKKSPPRRPSPRSPTRGRRKSII
ncbi:unnamed protein product [Trichobilharzia regenti]|nr:unnamed protein product [Trichobilharzia regenti]